MISRIIRSDTIRDIAPEVMGENEKLKLLPSKEWQKYPWDDFRAFCHIHARYGIPTEETVTFIKEIIGDRKCIEIGSGAGDFGHHLGITMTDNKQQEDLSIVKTYKAMQQPVIKYAKEIVRMDALDAVKTYSPNVVFASWVTTYSPYETTYGSNPFGIKEPQILDLVDTFILVGNVDIHGDKPIMNVRHDEYYFDWLVSRGKNQENNRIWIWDRKR